MYKRSKFNIEQKIVLLIRAQTIEFNITHGKYTTLSIFQIESSV